MKVGLVLLATFVPLTSLAGQRASLTVESEVDSRIADLTKLGANTPENEILLYEEMRRLDDDLARYRRLIREPSDGDRSIDSLSIDASGLLGIAASTSCEDRQAAAMLVRSAQDVAMRVEMSYPDNRPSDPWLIVGRLDDCSRLKTHLTTKASIDGLMAFVSRLRGEADRERQHAAAFREKATNLVRLLETRRATIQEKLNSRSSQQSLSSNLWKLMLVIGAFSLASIVAVKLFAESLQIEWVASGQVIQFVTVMVLLSVLMALGLAGILKENTLGTLLGGVAGYVLSQGIGRAAARQATLAQRARDGT